LRVKRRDPGSSDVGMREIKDGAMTGMFEVDEQGG
jgi:hypothetical protein